MDALSKNDSLFFYYLKALSILVIVFGHSGGFWAYKPYSEVLHVFVPVFFFVSGAVTFFSFQRSTSLFVFYKKRFVGLYVPYALLGGIALCCSIYVNGSFPAWSVEYLSEWVRLNPSEGASPFSVGHIWFLQTLFLITIISPLYFYLNINKPKILIFVVLTLISLSLLQLFVDVDNYFIFWRFNLYKALVHSSFYIMGAMLFSQPGWLQNKVLVTGAGVALCATIGVALGLKLDPDYANHTYAPDFYYVMGSFAAILLLLLLKANWITAIERITLIHKTAQFVSNNIFAFYLLHVPIILLYIHLFESSDGRVSVLMGLVRFGVVLMATALAAIPFTYLSSKVIRRILA